MTIILIAYFLFAVFTFISILPKALSKLTVFDIILMPLVAILWPIPWLYVILTEIFDVNAARKREKRAFQKQKEYQERERIRLMNEEKLNSGR